MFQIVIEVDADFDEITPPVVSPEDYEEDLKAGFAGIVAGVEPEDVSVYVDTEPEV